MFAMDIGGSLTKIAYYATVPSKKVLYDDEDSQKSEDVVYQVTTTFLLFPKK